MKFIDSPKKRLAWYSRNYFYIATVAVVVTNIALYACLGNSWTFAFGNGSVRWERSFDFQRIWRCFLNNFSHGTWQHALLNTSLQGCIWSARQAVSGFRDLSFPLPYSKDVSAQLPKEIHVLQRRHFRSILCRLPLRPSAQSRARNGIFLRCDRRAARSTAHGGGAPQRKGIGACRSFIIRLQPRRPEAGGAAQIKDLSFQRCIPGGSV